MIVTFLYRYPIFILGSVSLYFFPFEIVDSPLAIFIIFTSALVVLGTIIWADQYESEKKVYLLWAFLWGGLVATTASGLTYSFSSTIDESFLLAAFTEEFFKFVGLYVAFKKYMISWWTDGLVFGSMIGLGFTIFEDFDYIAFSDDPLGEALWRSLGSIFAHSFFTGVFGALFVVFLIKKDMFLTLFAFIFAGLSHYIWNYSTYFVESWWAYIILPPLTLVSLAYFLRISERDLIKTLFDDKDVYPEPSYAPNIYYDLKDRKKFINGLENRRSKQLAKKIISEDIHKTLIEHRNRTSPR
jgi:RsiW-degrading membrane proteinase PrsW (M82 family)